MTALEELYYDLHAHPELSFAEHRTAGIVADRLTALGLAVTTGIGRTGVVGVLANGDGPTVLLRADMDGLPVAEETGLPYASTQTVVDEYGHEVGLMHACGHDIHITCLIGAVERLLETRGEWSGTVVALFQPAEEHGGGAQVMVDDGLYEKVPTPDVVLGQHVAPYPAGIVGAHAGPAMAAVDALDVTMFGRGGHGSRPETTIDPVLMAAATVMRLQGVVSREVAAFDPAVVTVGFLNAGTKSNIIPAEAGIGISIRSFDETVRERVVGAVERIVRAEAQASGATREPEFAVTERYPVTVNDPDATERTNNAFRAAFGDDRVFDPGLIAGSEDVGNLATAAGVPLVYWFLGGADPDVYAAAEAAGTLDTDIPSNHSPFFAPLPQPTIDVGVQALVVAAREWLG
ncbi:amidohydrolase [Diaminobutyricibacter sp. McL0608]|uniref:amidohydrolase n=1 Tax=Leifsonia sp. McL0608 TaxID=3143537 RepID=UPI0031F2DA3E